MLFDKSVFLNFKFTEKIFIFDHFVEHIHRSFIFDNPEKEIIFLKSIDLGSHTCTLYRSRKVMTLKYIIKADKLSFLCYAQLNISLNLINFLNSISLSFAFAIWYHLRTNHFFNFRAIVIEFVISLNMLLYYFKFTFSNDRNEIGWVTLSV